MTGIRKRALGLAILLLTAHGVAGQDAAKADRDAVTKTAKDYEDAFNKADAKACAALWTDNGELREPDGTTHIGRTAIEKAHAEQFKKHPGAKIELLVKTVRFPAKDLAIEEGLVRSAGSEREMPACSRYAAMHIRENGTWKIALSTESAPTLNHLEDLEWLSGTWTAKAKEGELKIAIAKDAKKPLMMATMTRTPTGKDALTSTIRIAYDPETDKLRSWGFEDDGAHSQALWTHDGKSWLVETRGVNAAGVTFSETIVIQRLNADAITWHCTHRVFDGNELPDTTPIKLTRSK